MENLISKINQLIQWFENPVSELRATAFELKDSIEYETKALGIGIDAILFKDDLLILLSKLDQLREAVCSTSSTSFDTGDIYGDELYTESLYYYYLTVLAISRALADPEIKKSRFYAVQFEQSPPDKSRYQDHKNIIARNIRAPKFWLVTKAINYLRSLYFERRVLPLSSLVDSHTFNILRHFGITQLGQLRARFEQVKQYQGRILWPDGGFCADGFPLNARLKCKSLLSTYYC